MKFKVTFEQNLSKEDEQTIDQGLMDYIAEETGLAVNQKPAENCSFVVREDNTVLGGILGEIQLTTAKVNTLWVSKSARRKGIGTLLLTKFEEYAKYRGCTVIFLSTLSQNNITFYERSGYLIEFSRPNCLGEFTMYYFRKPLK